MATSLRAAIADARATQVPTATAHLSVASVVALGRMEARRMLIHPTFWVSFVACLFLARGVAGGGGTEGGAGENIGLILAAMLVGLLFGTTLTGNVAALRTRRDHTSELVGSLPAPPEARTAGLFAGLLLGPFGVSLVFTVAGWWLLHHLTDPDINPAEVDAFFLVQVPLAVLAMGSLAIAVARWIPNLLGGPAIIAAYLFTGLLWAVPWVMPRSSGIDAAWHLVYLGVAITTWVALAFARDRRTVARFAVAAIAFAVGICAAIQQVPADGSF
jgi:hypothetical protein